MVPENSDVFGLDQLRSTGAPAGTRHLPVKLSTHEAVQTALSLAILAISAGFAMSCLVTNAYIVLAPPLPTDRIAWGRRAR